MFFLLWFLIFSEVKYLSIYPICGSSFVIFSVQIFLPILLLVCLLLFVRFYCEIFLDIHIRWRDSAESSLMLPSYLTMTHL